MSLSPALAQALARRFIANGDLTDEACALIGLMVVGAVLLALQFV